MKNGSFIFVLFISFYICSCRSSRTDSTMQGESKVAPEVKSVFINGDSIHYIEIGRGDPVVFVHGALGDYRTWGKQMDTFSKNHRVIAYSRRFAYPNKQIINDSSNLTVVAHANDLSEFLKALNIGPAHLVGHSFGASTALLTTLNHPELVRSLTLGEAFFPSMMQNVPGGDTILNTFLTQTFGPVIEAFNNNNTEKAAKALVSGVMGDSSYYSTRFSQQDHEIILANTTELKGIVFSKNIFSPLTCADLKKIRVPVLLVGGDKSPLIFPDINNEMDGCLINREKAILANTTHGLEYENPLEFNKVVLGFIDKH